MRWTLFLPILILASFFTGASGTLSTLPYKARNPELGIVYNPTTWDRSQWDLVFLDPAPPAGWAIMPLGRESCSGITSWWLDGVRSQKLRPAIVLDPFLTKQEIEKTIDCAVGLGIRRAILDEYISYHNQNLNQNLCTVISEAREIYENAKRKHPGLQIDIDDNWQTWMMALGKGQEGTSCGPYPYYQFDQAGVSVLSKYGNPATGTCGHPTASELREQLADLKQTVRDYSRSRKIFVWQLNQHWYPGQADVLQIFREMKVLYGWNRFFLWGPTTDNRQIGNWGYTTSATRSDCAPSGYQWYMPARDYLIQMSLGAQSRIVAAVPATAQRGTYIPISGRILSGTNGIAVNNLQLRITAPPGSPDRFEQTIVAPPKARLALLGVRVNIELPRKMSGDARFDLDHVFFGRTGTSKNLVIDGDFHNSLDSWIVIGTAPVGVQYINGHNVVQTSCSVNQSISITSAPVFVIPGKSYTVRYDARVFREARNNGYFMVSWYTTKEIQRDRLFITFPQPETVVSTKTLSNGAFNFLWRSNEGGIFTISAFFPGSPDYRPSIRNKRIEIQ